MEAREKLRKEIAHILWIEKWRGLPFDCKGYDRQSGAEWDREREHLYCLADQILALGLVELDPGQSLPACPRFEWHDIDACETKCDFELMKKNCPLLKAGRRTVKP